MGALTDFPRQLLMPVVDERWEGGGAEQLGGGVSAEGYVAGHDLPRGPGSRVSPPLCTDTAKCSVHGIRVVKPTPGTVSWPGFW